jgi:formate dehydrogenase
LLGSVSGELGLREYLESNGHTFVVTADKDGPGSVFERELPDADVVISQPFWPAYLTAAISVSEHVVMMILGLVRNYIPSYQWVVKGGWHIAECVIAFL